MRYVIMYLLCGVAWMTYWFNKEWDYFNSEETTEVYKHVQRELFKSGTVLNIETVRKVLISIVFAWSVIIWPYLLLELYVFSKIKRIIKKH